MKKLVALLLTLAMLTGIAGVSAAQEPLTASAAGFDGDVTVTAELDDEGTIISLVADGSTQTPEVGGAAAETLNAGVLAALAGTKLADVDPAAIDGVTGATVTSNAVKTAIGMLKAQAGGTAAAPVKDGTYTVTVPGYSVTEQMTLNVTFADGRLEGIETVVLGNTPSIFATVEKNL